MKSTRTLFERYDELRQKDGRAPVLQAVEYQRAEKKVDGTTEFIMSTGGVKYDGFEIVQAGWQLADFLAKNPLAPWRHSTYSPRDAMGIWPDVWKSNKGGLALHLRGLLKWNTGDHNPDAPYVQKMYDDGVLRACSVRWEEADADAIEMIDAKDLEDLNVDWYSKMYGGIRFLRSLLIECSPCMLGMDKDALSARTRAGGVPKSILDRFVVTPGDKSDQVIEGRTVMLLDGHPLRTEVDVPGFIDLGARRRDDDAAQDGRRAHHHERVECRACGNVVTCRCSAPKETTYVDTCDACASARGVALNDPFIRSRRAQRLMRGDGDDALRTALTAAYERAGEAPPWASAIGQSYQGLHQGLAAIGDGDPAALRSTIEQVGRHLFGDQRLREAWEPRQLPPGLADLWKPLGEVAERVLGRYLADAIDADTATDALLSESAEAVAPVMGGIAWLGRAVARLGADAGVDVQIGDDAALDAAFAKIRTPAPEAHADDAASLDFGPVVASVSAIQERRRKREEAKPPDPPPTAASGARRRFKSLLDRISQPGGDSPSGAEA